MGQHWFWWTLTMASLGWYALVTGYVAWHGARDIRGMFKRLDKLREDEA